MWRRTRLSSDAVPNVLRAARALCQPLPVPARGVRLGSRWVPGLGALSRGPLRTGYRHWHADLRPDDSPLEAGLAFTCKLKSAIPFLGREALQQQRAAGLRRRLVCFTVDE